MSKFDIKKVLIFLSLILTSLIIYEGFCPVIGDARQKSTVLLVFNNQSGRDSGEKLNEIAYQELGKKINGVYNVVDNKIYQEKFAEKSYFEKDLEEMADLVKDSSADYFVYVELMPFKQAEGFNIIWHRKKMVSNIGLRIVELKSNEEIFQEKYSVEKNDDTDFFFVGSSSMARKSLKGALFVVGEAISVHLPL